MKSGTKTIIIVVLALLLAVAIGGCAFLFFGRKGEKNPNVSIDPGTSDSEVVEYLKEQLTQTQEQLTDANILLQGYLKQIEEANKNNQTLTEQNQALNSTIQSLQETVKSLNAEVQRLTQLLEQYGNIAEGTWEVHFYDGEDMVKLLLIRNNSKITETVTAEREGFEFKGWATEQGGQAVDYQNIEITQETNFYAVFERKTGLLNDQGAKIKTWDELVEQGEISTYGTEIVKVNTALEGYLVIPDSFTKIRSNAFLNCERITKIDCYGVSSIGMFAFRNCYRLREINYSNSITIDIAAFDCCDNLRSLTLPEETTLMGYVCSSELLEVVNNSTLSTEEIKSALRLHTKIEDFEGIHSGESRIKEIEGINYYVHNDWFIAVGVADSRENLKLADECNMVLENAFRYQDQIKNFALKEMPDDVDFHLGRGCFSQCTGLETLWVPTWLVYGSKADYDTGFLVNCPLATVYIESKNNPYGRDMTREIDTFMADANRTSDNPGPKGYVTDVSRRDYLQQFGF